jgi:sec-independent protein translocase protein TatB
MMGIGFTELLVILVVALVAFGPDRLPDFARQAGRFVRQVSKMTHQARDDLRSELGPEYADFELSDLDPRRAIRKHILEVWDEDDDEDDGPGSSRKGRSTGRPLKAGELPPYDVDAT